MQLDYLVFDTSDEDSGRGSFDAMASVAPGRLPVLLAELRAVLRWAHAAFGPAGAQGDDADWDVDLQGLVEPGEPLDVSYDEDTGEVALAPAVKAATSATVNTATSAALTTITLTLSGSPSFCEAFCAAFELND